MICNYNNFVEESYLDSNHAPLYHYTNMWALKDILATNKLTLGYYNHSVGKNQIKIISLTRDKFFNIEDKDFEVKICLDKAKLINDYKANPYDFFNNKGDKKKWEIDRINPFKSEEIICRNITNLNKYILYIDFF